MRQRSYARIFIPPCWRGVRGEKEPAGGCRDAGARATLGRRPVAAAKSVCTTAAVAMIMARTAEPLHSRTWRPTPSRSRSWHDTTFTVSSDGVPGEPRTYGSFSDVLAEITLARIAGGIHFRFACGARAANRRRRRHLHDVPRPPPSTRGSLGRTHSSVGRAHGVRFSRVRARARGGGRGRCGSESRA
jgi:hypothetical protein